MTGVVFWRAGSRDVEDHLCFERTTPSAEAAATPLRKEGSKAFTAPSAASADGAAHPSYP